MSRAVAHPADTGTGAASSSATSSPPRPGTPPGARASICEVCCDALPASQRAGCGGCAHRYCARCVGTYWEGLIFSGAHSRLHCMFGGCGVSATDVDVARVVPPRVFRRMLYFRARDAHASNPHARFCPTDGCWALVSTKPAPSEGDASASCGECEQKMCLRCERAVTPGEMHECVTRKPAPRQRLLFSLWAASHTKSCPQCGTRIQRSRGCSHMTCARCAAYFCWRCRGFLHADCARGRACVCDRILTGAAYSGLVAAAVIGAPVLIAGAVVGGAPWLVYRLVKRSKARAADERDPYARERDPAGPYGLAFLQEQVGLFSVDEVRAHARYAHRARVVLDSDTESDLLSEGDAALYPHGRWEEVDSLTGGQRTAVDVAVDEPSVELVCGATVPRGIGTGAAGAIRQE